ncbi:RdgB/HAM1 family non-canonical purine NTP pyrophosphatase [Sediminibacterium sp.]|uniref:RdgB/HAM1 family non-canonical purine NTP pyrophosphatase n=1 Tax=Sediminibacterium sp. TaxID=1917865 RepID=UPI003F6EF844
MANIDLIFATNNANKVKEIKAVTGNHLNILSLKEAGIEIDIPEPHDTLEANASEKSRVIHAITKKNCFSEDTGLEVFALNGEPGVKSARYAGDTRDFQANIDLLLHRLSNKVNKTAQFRTVISLIWNNQEYLFEGICKGQINADQKGSEGFGYDPIFIPDGSSKRFAEMTMDEKNKFSHRKKAMQQLMSFLNTKW